MLHRLVIKGRPWLLLAIMLLGGHAVLRAQGAAPAVKDDTQQQINKLFQAQAQRQAAERLRYTGSVSGHVVCGDTQRAARVADVQFIPLDSVEKVISGHPEPFVDNSSYGTRTDLEGNFQTDHVAPGEYYVVAALPGYLSAAEQVFAGASSEEDLRKLLEAIPRVTVGDGAISVALALQRGAVVTGAVRWDDGSPASNIQIMAIPKPKAGTEQDADGSSASTPLQKKAMAITNLLRPMAFGLVATSDDGGHFRLSALRAGDYLLRASIFLPTPNGSYGAYFEMLSVYAPGKLRKTEATALSLHDGEQRSEVQLDLPLSAMHTVSGQAGASDGERIQGGTVTLEDSVDHSLHRSGMIASDGSFRIQWVPAGTYTLKARGGPKPMPAASQPVNNEVLGEAEQTIIVGDTDLPGVEVSLSSPKAKDAR